MTNSQTQLSHLAHSTQILSEVSSCVSLRESLRSRCQESIKGARNLLEEMLINAEGVKEQEEAKTVIPSES